MMRIIGMLMEASAVVLCTVPIVVPLFRIIGIDLIYFGVLVGILMSIGTLTPPVGTCLYIGAGLTDLPVMKLFKGMAPFLAANIAVLLLVTYIPQISLVLLGGG